MFDCLEEVVTDYNNKNADMGGKCLLQRVQGNGADEDLILSICTLLMSRVHTTRQAGEMAFMDSSGSLDRYNCFLNVYSSSQWSATSCSLGNFKSIPIMSGKLPWSIKNNSHAFGGKGPQKGSDIFMTDDDTGQRKRLECTSNRLHSYCVFFTFCKQHGGG